MNRLPQPVSYLLYDGDNDLQRLVSFTAGALDLCIFSYAIMAVMIM